MCGKECQRLRLVLSQFGWLNTRTFLIMSPLMQTELSVGPQVIKTNIKVLHYVQFNFLADAFFSF